MSTDEASSTYAPQSPDLSSFYSGSPTQAAPQLQPPTSHGQAGYKLQPPTYGYASPHAASSLYNPSSSYGAPPAAIATAPTSHPAVKFESYDNYPPPELQAHEENLASGQNNAARAPYGLQPPTFESPTHPQSYYPVQGHYQPFPTDSSFPPTSEMPPRKGAAAAPPAPVIEPSPVRTKFPTARIKRIMQADEEVGKVAQQTPIAVGKALELFMIQMVTKSAEVAKEKGSKRVTASMLKQVVETDEQWDFLRDIVSRVENEKEGSKSKAKAESESDNEMEEPKKRGRGGRRKKAE